MRVGQARETSPGMWLCLKCRQAKPRERFYKRYKGGVCPDPECKDCIRARQRAWYAQNGKGGVKGRFLSLRSSMRHFRKKNGLPETANEEYALALAQLGRCAICDRQMEPGRRTVLDHDHDTKQIRGLLCNRCNMGLGCFLDKALNLEKAAIYLRFFSNGGSLLTA